MYLSQLKRVTTFFLFISILVAGLLIVVLAFEKNKLRIYFFDVGEGDSTLIKLPNNIEILIDGGKEGATLAKVGKYMPFYDKTIEYVILSHPHRDHYGGLIDIFKRYTIGVFIHNGIQNPHPSYRTFRNVILEKKISEVIIDSEKDLRLGEDAVIQFLYPDADVIDASGDLNTYSIVAKLIYKNASVLFTGDMPKEIETLLLTKGKDVKADILKVAHQGSKTSSREQFIRRVAPQYAVISVGENSYGHPHFRTLFTFEKLNIPVLRTDQEGDIVFQSNGKDIQLKN